MRRLLLAVLTLGLVVLVAVVDPKPAAACSCTGISTRRALEQADAVFAGTVTEVEETGPRRSRRAEIRFQVSRVYKGTVYAEQLVSSPVDSAGCGITPEVDSDWVIFGDYTIVGSDDDAVRRLQTTLCSGNLQGGDPPASLGRGEQPQPGPSDREERAVTADTLLTRGLMVTGFGVLGLLALTGIGLAYLWRTGRS